jgi:glycosyltransferase involved in cell wall biosynthesis
MTELADVKVVAPLAVFDYAAMWTRAGMKKQRVPDRRWDEALEVFHPRWLYPPGAGALNTFFLTASLLPRIWRLFRRYRFQLIDAHFGHPTAAVAAVLSAAFRRPFFVTLRGDETRHASYRLRRHWMSWSLRRACRVITVSERLREFAIGLGAKPDRVYTIPNGIDCRMYFQRDRDAMRVRHGIAPGRLMVLSAGYLIERKGHHRAIEALRTLRLKEIDADLWIVGGAGREGRYEAALRSLVGDLGLAEHVHFTGGVPQEVLAEYMSAADVFCLASSREGWPNVVHEALGCGTPVVASDVGGVPDLIPSRNYGIVVPIGDQKALEAALEEALLRQWNRPAIAAWAQSRSWEQVAAEVIRQAQQGVEENNLMQGRK